MATAAAANATPCVQVVKIGEAVGTMCLAGLPSDLWPPADAANGLRADVAKLERCGVVTPYIYVNLDKDWLPHWARVSSTNDDHKTDTCETTAALAKAFGIQCGKRTRQFLSPGQWQAAWSRCQAGMRCSIRFFVASHCQVQHCGRRGRTDVPYRVMGTRRQRRTRRRGGAQTWIPAHNGRSI